MQRYEVGNNTNLDCPVSVHAVIGRQLAQALSELESLYRILAQHQSMLQIEALGLRAFQ